MSKKANVVEDSKGRKVVIIDDVFFRGKGPVDWNIVEEYLKQYIGEYFIVLETNDLIHIGADLPDEYAHSEYTHILRGANAKAKANAIKGLREIIEISSERKFTENYKDKHRKDAQRGWYRYESRFALPIINDNGNIERYNVFCVVMVVRHSKDGKKYLYDIINIKKETSNLFQSKDFTQ